MAPALTVPTDPDGFRDLLSKSDKITEFFSKEAVLNGTTKKFLDAYASNFVANNSDTVDHLREQVQNIMFDMVRANGGGRGSKLDLSNAVQFTNGKPTLSLSQGGTAALAHGRGAVYNRTSMGARMEEHIKEDDRFSSIGEYCQAIRAKGSPGTYSGKRGQALLDKLDRVTEFMNSFGSEDPGAGGFLIPEIMRSELLQLALEDAIVRSRATVIPMSTLSVPIPTVDDTSHVSSVMGGIQFYWAEESATLTESQATFGRVNLVAKKLAGFFKVPNELLNDAPAFSAFFDTQVPKGLAYFEDISFMTETGTGTPQGFISCPASVSVPIQAGQATKTILWENIVAMYAQMLPQSIPNAVWICSIDAFPQLATMALSVGTGGGPVWIGNYGGGSSGQSTPPMTILGRPVLFTEKIGPLGTTGDINFVDLSYYLIGDRQAVEVAASDQFAFQNDQTAFRLIERVDGRPWLQSPLTPHNNSANLLSPFVQLVSR